MSNCRQGKSLLGCLKKVDHYKRKQQHVKHTQKRQPPGLALAPTYTQKDQGTP